MGVYVLAGKGIGVWGGGKVCDALEGDAKVILEISVGEREGGAKDPVRMGAFGGSGELVGGE